MKYLVQLETLAGEQQEKNFQTYREALCCATNYAHFKFSKVIRQGEVINEFKFKQSYKIKKRQSSGC